MKKALLATMGLSMMMASAGTGQSTKRLNIPEPTPADQDSISEKSGLTKFEYGSNYLYALNKKTADKKAKKRGWI